MEDNAPSQLHKFRTKNWVEINDNSCGTCSTNISIKFKTLMLKSSLCDYSQGGNLKIRVSTILLNLGNWALETVGGVKDLTG